MGPGQKSYRQPRRACELVLASHKKGRGHFALTLTPILTYRQPHSSNFNKINSSSGYFTCCTAKNFCQWRKMNFIKNIN